MGVRLENLPAGIQAKVAAQLGVEKPGAGKRKYHNTPCEMDGDKFDSKAERDEYAGLLLRAKAKDITDLKRQVPFRLELNGVHICTYWADYVYRVVATGEVVVADKKGGKATQTAVFRLKARLMKAIHGIEITII